MAEEHRCQPQRLCTNNCGFLGSPATQNLCSKCYRDLQLKEQQELVLNQTQLSSSSSSSSSPSSSASPSTSMSVPTSATIPSTVVDKEEKARVEANALAVPNRCGTCRRRVGLTGFTCRCRMTFCGSHRYPERHGCAFDFKGLGKDQIAKANPVVKAEKLRKI